MKNRRTKIKFPVFNGFEVHVIEAADIVRTGRRFKEDLADAEAGFIYKPDRPYSSWMVFGYSPAPDIIAHEAAHAVRHMFKAVGVAEDDESFSYHLGYLVDRLHKFLRKGK